MSGSAVRAGRAFIEVFLKDQVTAGLRGMQSRMQAMSGVLARTGGVAFGAGTAIAAGLLRPISAASDLQEIMSKFETVFGENSQQVKQWGDQFASQVGRSKQQVAEFLAGSQDLFVPLGFDEASATALSKTITGLSIDLASFNNGTDSDALRDLHAALTGSGEVMKKYGVIVSEAAVKQELLAQGIKATDATEQEKVMARLSIIMRGTTAAQGDAIKTAGSWANQNKRIVGSIVDLSSRIGSVLIPLLSPYQTMVGDILARADGWIEKNRFIVLGVAAVAAGLLVGGAAMLGLSAATYAASIAFSGLASVTGLVGSTIGVAISLIRSLSGVMLLQRAVSGAAAAAMLVYGEAITVARGIMVGLAGTIGVARLAVAGLRLGFLATAAGITGVTAATGLLRAALAAVNVHQLALGAGAAVLRGVEAVWMGITAAVSVARGAMTLAGLQQLAFGTGAAILGTVRAAWAGIRSVTLGTAGAMSLMRMVSLTTAGALALMSLAANGGAGAMSLLSGALAAVQAAALGPLAPIALVAAAVAGLGAVLYVNRETVFDFLGNSLAGLGPILDGVSTQWSAFAAGISTWFAGIVGEAKIAWDGISAAIAVNDLQAAWTIAWNTMKLVALQTFGPLQIAWGEFSTGMLSVMDGVWTSIRQTFNAGSTFIADMIFGLIGHVQSLLDSLAQYDPTGLAQGLRDAIDVDTQGIRDTLAQDSERVDQGLERDRQTRDEQRGAELAESQAELAKSIAEAEADIRKARDEAVATAKARQAEQASALAEPVAADQEEFDVAKLFADAMAGQKETGRETSGGSSPDISGTFSSAALAIAAASGGSSVDQEQLRAQQEQLKKQDVLIKVTGDMARDLAAAWTVG